MKTPNNIIQDAYNLGAEKRKIEESVTPRINLWTVLVVFIVMLAGVYLFAWVYNSPAFAETICRDEYVHFGYGCRVVTYMNDNSVAQIWIDGNWRDICDTNVGHYCDALQ
jgi:hypothetical protein